MEITHASAFPLIGGMGIASMQELGRPPEYVISQPGSFYGNDKLFLNYLKDKGYDVPYYDINEEDLSLPRVDMVSCLNVCSGLSMMNTSKNKNRAGADAEQNQWMYDSAEFIMRNIKPRVIFGENAPGLSTARGIPVAENLFEIGQKNGYSFSLIKTNTVLHGTPQKRERTFYFFWDSENAPVMNWYSTPHEKASDFISKVPKMGDNLDEKFEREEDYSTVMWLRQHKEFIPRIMEQDYNIFSFIVYNPDARETYLEFVHKNYENPEKELRYLNHALKKREMGMGYWSDHPSLMFKDYTRTITGKTLNYLNPDTLEFYSMRQIMELMRLPRDFSLGDEPRKEFRKITQNVPVNTARDWVKEIKKYINGELELSETPYLFQNNIKQTSEDRYILKHETLF